jgi:hypothetical protein
MCSDANPLFFLHGTHSLRRAGKNKSSLPGVKTCHKYSVAPDLHLKKCKNNAFSAGTCPFMKENITKGRNKILPHLRIFIVFRRQKPAWRFI